MKNRSTRAKSVDTSVDATIGKAAESGLKQKLSTHKQQPQSRGKATKSSKRTPVRAKIPITESLSLSIEDLEEEIVKLEALLETPVRKVKQTKLERVNQLRRCLLYHSCLYYKFGTSVIEDSTWDDWARELLKLQKNDKLKKSGWNPQIFADWTGETGYHLPLDEDWVKQEALYMLKLFKDENKNVS